MKRLAFLLLSASLTAPALAAGPAPSPVHDPLLVPVQTDYRVNELQEQVRELNGKVEELTFQLLQLQEQIRKMQEDNELRFQELEDKRSDASGGPEERLGKPEAPGADAPGAQAADQTDASGAGVATAPPPAPSDEAPADRTNPAPSAVPEQAAPPRALGTLIFDKDGNVVDAGPAPDGAGTSSPLDAAEFGATPREVLDAARAAFDARDFATAERAAASHVQAWPEDETTVAARTLRGEALFWLKRYDEAADLNLQTLKAHPDDASAPDNMLYLALSLAGLNQREVACATLAEILARYPRARERLGVRIGDEQAAMRC